ncbi:protein kinase domain-containing protein [Metarhizium album ARSEF 1941]|uniref:EKC/KEOPS complex subunit BUD32 n=1 Tax=Metarhizium album (strain ARSEF 1941) TaxID=1081103 RepID=A0A0B2WL15_METAS|nr:protein kinase domain-containing protein [Metarhizium album ARSEF 1941]KHN93710.1 protein kinase domain-containing protein [Metarhizium album ARSEF 1941]
MLQRSSLAAWLKAVASWVATLKSLVFQPAWSFYNVLRSFGSTQKSAHYLKEPQLLSLGSTGLVFKLSDAIVVKKSRPGRSDYIADEQKIFAILKRQPLSPYIIQHFHDTKDAIFLEFMSGGNLGTVLNDEQVKDESTQRVIRVEKLQTAEDCLRWTRQLAAAAAWLEQLGFTHCDIRPANMLLSDARDTKLADFDHTRKIGDTVPSLTEPFARLLGDEGGSNCGTYGTAGYRTEQFAIGSVIYALTRGHDPYEDEWWGPDHGPIRQGKLQDMEFPVLGKDKYDDVIENCWHGRYESIAQLSGRMAGLDHYSSEVIEQQASASDIRSRKHECEMLVQNGVLQKLFTC